MIPPPLVTPAVLQRARSGFSLIEVTLAIGLLAFCLIPLMGLLPTGLNAQHNATEAALSADALAMVSTAVRSSQLITRNSGGTITYRLPKYFSDIASQPADPPSNSNSDTFETGKAFKTHVYAVMEDGSIRKNGNTKQARLTMYVKITPPATDGQIAGNDPLNALPGGNVTPPSSAVRVYALIAWPSLPSDNSNTTLTQLKGRQGYIEGFITYVPNQ